MVYPVLPMMSDYMLTKKQWVLSALLSSFWCLFLYFFGSSAFTLEFKWRDHLSNISMTQVFFKHGSKVYSEPKKDLVELWPTEEPVPEKFRHYLPKDEPFYRLDGKPLHLVWPEISNPYPPGDYFYYWPFSFMAYNLNLGFGPAAAAFVWITLILAHLSFFLFWNAGRPLRRDIFEEVMSSSNMTWKKIFEASFFRKFLFGLIYFLLYCELCRWPMNAQYETVALPFLLFSLLFSVKKKWTSAILMVGLAMFFHPRALIFTPFVLIWFFQWLRSPEQKTWSHDLLRLGLAAFGALTLAQAIYLSLGVHNSTTVFHHLNKWGFEGLAQEPWRLLIILLSLGFICVLLIKEKLWMAVVFVAWTSLLFMQSAQIRPWYVTLMLPLLFLGLLERESTHFSASRKWKPFLLCAIAYFVLVQFYPGNSPLDFQFVKDVVSSFTNPGLLEQKQF